MAEGAAAVSYPKLYSTTHHTPKRSVANGVFFEHPLMQTATLVPYQKANAIWLGSFQKKQLPYFMSHGQQSKQIPHSSSQSKCFCLCLFRKN